MNQSVSIEPKLALFTMEPIRVIKTIITTSSNTITSIGIILIDIVIATAPLTLTLSLQRISVKHGLTSIASFARISLSTITFERARRLTKHAIDCEIVAIHTGTRTRFARDPV